MENRAAVFTNSAQDVEVYRARAWEPGSMLGWRHAPDGSCQAWVRLAAGGAQDAVWLDLADVRLPEPPSLNSVDDAPAGVVRALAGIPQPRSGAESGGPWPSDATATMNLVAVRDGVPPSHGAAPVRGTGGRRRASEEHTGDGAAAYWAALDGNGARAIEPPATPGRHRAPAPGVFGAGRHRAADTGLMPAIPADAGSRDAAPRTVATPALPALSGGASDDEADAHLYTRPLRLATSVTPSRSGGRGAAGR
jgi:hypothetical protein